MSSQAHYDAVKARLQADTALASRVFDSAREDSEGKLIRDNYVILFGGGPDVLDSERLTKSQDVDDDAEYVYTLRSVGTTPDACRAVQSHVQTQLIGAKLTISGRMCRKMRLTESGQVEPDSTVTPPLYYVDDTFELASSPA